VRFNREWLDQPLRWTRPRMIFVCAHGDLFHESVPDEWIDLVFAVMALAPQHTFQVLTKRAARMRRYFGGGQGQRGAADFTDTERRIEMAADTIAGRPSVKVGVLPLPNVWLGISAEDQPRLEERWPYLATTPAAVRWISAEPLLGGLDLNNVRVHPMAHISALRAATVGLAVPGFGWPTELAAIDWVVAGGESGPGARPMNPAWVRQLHDQCKGAEVPFFFKQWGAWISSSEAGYSTWDRTGRRDGQVLGRVSGFDPRRGTPGLDGRDWPSAYPFPSPPDPGPVMINVGKANAGRLLNGVQHNGMPAARKERP